MVDAPDLVATAALGEPAVFWSPSILEATAAFGTPIATTVIDMPSLGASATISNITYSLTANPIALTANVVLSIPVTAILFFPDGLAADTALGEPTWASVADTHPILSWSRLDPVLASGYETSITPTIIVFNANTLSISEYNLAALDVIEYEGELYFVTATGLIKLSEDGLENINSYIQTGQLNFGVSNIKYIQNMSVDTPPDSSLMITGFIEQPNGDVYMFPTKDAYRDSLNQQTRIFKLPKGIRSTYWGFKFENDGTNTFELIDITLDILDTVLKR